MPEQGPVGRPRACQVRAPEPDLAVPVPARVGQALGLDQAGPPPACQVQAPEPARVARAHARAASASAHRNS